MLFSSKTQIPPSATVTINGLAQAKKMAGQRVYNLSAGEPILDTSRYLQAAVDEAMKQGRTLYPPVPGVEELRILATQWINNLYGTNYGVKNTLISCGGKFGIYLSLQALLNDGDEVLVIAPYWVSYPPMVQLFGGVPVVIGTEKKNSWKVSAAQIDQACTSKTKLLILNNGSNPTGVLYAREELEAILKVAKAKNILVMSDEVYSGLVYDGHEYISCGSFPEYADRVIVIQSCSKNFGMTGWRVGLIFSPEEITKMLIKLQGQSITGTSIISQWAAIAALKQAKKITAEICKEMQHRRDIFTNTFNELFPEKISPPLSAFYSFIPLTAFGDVKNLWGSEATGRAADFVERGRHSERLPKGAHGEATGRARTRGTPEVSLQQNTANKGGSGSARPSASERLPKEDVKFCEKVLEEGNIALVPGSAFGKSGYVRASFGAKPQELKDALTALAHFLKK